MPAAAVFEAAIPDAGVAAVFANGEKALAVSATLASTTTGVRHLARRFVLEGGEYTLRVYCKDACSVWFGQDGISLGRIAVTAPNAATYTEVTFWANPGDNRLDVVLSKLGATGPCYVVLTLYRDGSPIYVSTASGWMFDTSPVLDVDLPSTGDARLLLPVFTLTPNWASGVIERLQWATSIAQSETDDEQRRSLRRHPRRSFEAQFLRSGLGFQRLKNFVAAIGRRTFLVPLFHDQYRLPAALGLSDDTIEFPSGTLLYREWFPGNLILLMRDDPEDWEIVEVATRDTASDTITLVDPPTRAWPARTWARPLREAWMPDNAQQQMLSDRVATVGMRFELVDTERNIVNDWGYCAPLWRFDPNWADLIGLDTSTKTYDLDFTPAAPVSTHPSGQVRMLQRIGVQLKGREQVAGFRSFVGMARGSAVRFYMPSYTHDVTPGQDLTGNVLYALKAGFTDYFNQPQQSEVLLGFEFRDGRPAVYRRVLAVTSDGDFDLFSLDGALPDVPRSALRRVQWIVPSRFEHDAFELTHLVDACKVVTATVVTRSAPIDGLPPIECVVTSQPYPVVIDGDAVNVTAAILGGEYRIPPQLLSLDISAELTGGSFPLIVAYLDIDSLEELDVSAELTGGSFPLIVGYMDTSSSDELDVTASLTGGTLLVALITYDIVPESLNVSAAITGGTLT